MRLPTATLLHNRPGEHASFTTRRGSKSDEECPAHRTANSCSSVGAPPTTGDTLGSGRGNRFAASAQEPPAIWSRTGVAVPRCFLTSWADHPRAGTTAKNRKCMSKCLETFGRGRDLCATYPRYRPVLVRGVVVLRAPLGTRALIGYLSTTLFALLLRGLSLRSSTHLGPNQTQGTNRCPSPTPRPPTSKNGSMREEAWLKGHKDVRRNLSIRKTPATDSVRALLSGREPMEEGEGRGRGRQLPRDLERENAYHEDFFDATPSTQACSSPCQRDPHRSRAPRDYPRAWTERRELHHIARPEARSRSAPLLRRSRPRQHRQEAKGLGSRSRGPPLGGRQRPPPHRERAHLLRPPGMLFWRITTP